VLQGSNFRRPPFIFWACLIGVGAAVPIVFIAVDLLLLNATRLLGRDFAGFWAAGRLAGTGHPAAAYDSTSITAVLATLNVGIVQPFVYPPPALLVLAPFGLLPYWAALPAWTAAGALLVAWAAKAVVPFRPAIALLTPAALLNVWDGQFGFFFGALWLCVFRFKPALSGAAAGIAALKPHLAVLLLARLVRTPRSLAVAALVAAILAAVTFPLWALFFAAAREHASFVSRALRDSFFLRMMPGPFESYGSSWVAQALFTVAALGILIHYRCSDVFALATASFLILPYAHNYDMTVASLGCIVALRRGWNDRSPIERAILSGGYLSPVLTFAVPYAVPPLLLATLYVQAAGGESRSGAPSELV
jgi:alpha-1,2-mannosyltransferase